MPNHPGRAPGSAAGPQRMTPDQLRDIIERAGITQARAAELAGVGLRTMQQYIAGDRTMPLSASGLLVVSLVILGAPAGLLAPWVSEEVAARLGAGQP